jgi:hypothetical protein
LLASAAAASLIFQSAEKETPMKMSVLTTSILTLFLGLTLAQSKCNQVKTKTVSAQTIANLPPGKTYEIDLTRKGTIYDFKDPNTDFSRVTLRSATDVRTFTELLKMSNATVKKHWVIGNAKDLAKTILRSGAGGGGGSNYQCGSFICSCRGLSDCFDMAGSDNCVGHTWCNPDPDLSQICYCIMPPTAPPSPSPPEH